MLTLNSFIFLGGLNLEENNDSTIMLTAEIVSSYLSNNAMQAGDIPGLIKSVHKALVEAETSAQEPEKQVHEPVVSVKTSIKPDHLVCLECGAKQKTLKRHLNSSHGLSPAEYKDRYGLPADYPLVAPDYAKQRSKLAKKIGLGRKRSEL
jgi:predicted transcriptional regulator